MMSIVFHRLVVALSVVAFVSGMTMQAMPSAQALGPGTAERIAKADPECPRMAMEHHGDTIPTPRPCKGIMLDCVKQMGCLGTPALPDRSDAVSVPVAYSLVAYWAPCSALSGRDVEPDLFPPITG
jgi:hypothetical protein